MVPTHAGMVPRRVRMVPTRAGMVPRRVRMVPTHAGMVPRRVRMVPTRAGMIPRRVRMVPGRLKTILTRRKFNCGNSGFRVTDLRGRNPLINTAFQRGDPRTRAGKNRLNGFFIRAPCAPGSSRGLMRSFLQRMRSFLPGILHLRARRFPPPRHIYMPPRQKTLPPPVGDDVRSLYLIPP